MEHCHGREGFELSRRATFLGRIKTHSPQTLTRVLRSVLDRARAPRSADRYDVAFYMPRMTPVFTESRAPGGAELQVYMIGRALQQQGLRVAFIAGDLPGGLPSSVNGIDVFPRAPYVEGQHRRLGGLAETLATWRALARVRAKFVVFRQAGIETGVIALFTRLRGQHFVWSSSNVIDFEWHELMPAWRDNAMFRLGVRLSYEAVVQTEDQVEMCRHSFGKEAVVIKSIAEVAPRRKEASAFLWVGRLAAYKRPLDYLELARRLPDARFRMVGTRQDWNREERALADEVERQAGELHNFELLERRPRPDVLRLFDEAVASVNTADFEGMPNTFLEGWARGVPALSLSFDPGGVIARHGVGACAAGNIDRFINEARNLWERRADSRDLEERCLRYLQDHHSADVVASQWMKALGYRVPGMTHPALAT